MSRSASLDDDLPADQIRDYCPECGEECRHRVSIEIRTSGDGKHKACSNSPHRVATCVDCGEETVSRARSL